MRDRDRPPIEIDRKPLHDVEAVQTHPHELLLGGAIHLTDPKGRSSERRSIDSFDHCRWEDRRLRPHQALVNSVPIPLMDEVHDLLAVLATSRRIVGAVPAHVRVEQLGQRLKVALGRRFPGEANACAIVLKHRRIALFSVGAVQLGRVQRKASAPQDTLGEPRSGNGAGVLQPGCGFRFNFNPARPQDLPPPCLEGANARRPPPAAAAGSSSSLTLPEETCARPTLVILISHNNNDIS